jgi:hypothetical protein
MRESKWLGEVEGPLSCANAVPGIGVPRSARDDKSQIISANSAVSAVKDIEVFLALAKAGRCLTEIHAHYEQQPEYKLTKKEKVGEKLNWRRVAHLIQMSFTY